MIFTKGLFDPELEFMTNFVIDPSKSSTVLINLGLIPKNNASLDLQMSLKLRGLFLKTFNINSNVFYFLKKSYAFLIIEIIKALKRKLNNNLFLKMKVNTVFV